MMSHQHTYKIKYISGDIEVKLDSTDKDFVEKHLDLIPPEFHYAGFIDQLLIGEQPTQGNNFNHFIKVKGQITMLQLTDTQQAEGTISFVDKKGQPTKADNETITATSSDENVATASYDAESQKLTVVAGKPGAAVLHIDAADPDGKTLPFEDTAIEVTSGTAVSGAIAFGAATEQPDVNPLGKGKRK